MTVLTRKNNYCKGIYAGCAAVGSMSPCAPCERIKHRKSTIEKEMQRKRRGELEGTRQRLKREAREACPYKAGCNCEATNQRCIREIKRERVALPDMSGTTVSSRGKTITIVCGDHDTKDALLSALTA